ncbi:MAG: hypothetical protein DCC75_07480 [Proteobacteria bacterium]|nr:MAG: hypothetical protein DCC75_07480 [Pseudomonadota bacterium]
MRRCRFIKWVLLMVAFAPMALTWPDSVGAQASQNQSAKTAKAAKSTTKNTGPRVLVLDTVLASVGDKPITLSDLGKRLEPPRTLSAQDAASDPQARDTLEIMIFETLIEEEAEARRLKVDEQDLNEYLEEVAARNNMSRDNFEQALKEQNRSLDDYKQRVRIDILRSRLAGQVTQSGTGVSEEEIRNYLTEHPEFSKSGSKLKLSQIFVSLEGRSEEDAAARIKEIQAKLEDGEDFSDLAKEYSDAPDAQEGGSLGILAEEDISRALFDSIYGLDEEEVSAPIESPAGIRLVRLDKRYVEDSEQGPAVVEEVRRILQKQKADIRLRSFFTAEIYKNHPVDKKI